MNLPAVRSGRARTNRPWRASCWTKDPDLRAVADFQAIHAAITLAQRGPDGRFPLRDDDLLPLTEYVRRAVVTGAVRREIGLIATNSATARSARRQFLLGQLGEGATERVIDPGADIVRARLSDPFDGALSAECDAAINRWVPKMTATEIRCAIELRQDESRAGPGRVIGTLMRYGERAADRPEKFADGALAWPPDGIVLNEQHNRQAPIMRVVPETRDGAVVIDAALPDTQRGRDAATMIRNGTFKGLSVEFRAIEERMTGWRSRHSPGRPVRRRLGR